MAPSRRDQEFESPFLQGESAANPISAFVIVQAQAGF
jgi:hypothetical protein